MATNLAIDEKLLAEALRLGGRRTKRETVNDALAEYIMYRKRLRSLELIGQIDMAPGPRTKPKRRRKRER